MGSLRPAQDPNLQDTYRHDFKAKCCACVTLVKHMVSYERLLKRLLPFLFKGKDTHVHQHVNQHACTRVPLLSRCLSLCRHVYLLPALPSPRACIGFLLPPGRSRERRAVRGDLLLLLVTSAAAPLAARSGWCAGGDARRRPLGQQRCPPCCGA